MELTGKVLFNRYLVGDCIGAGSFGEVHLAYDVETDQIYALKSEEEKAKNPQLINEARIIKELNGEKGFVKFVHYGYECKCHLIVMGLLGPSLQDLFNVCKRNFSLKTILMLAEQIISRLEVLHSKNFVYRDIKPENLLMGLYENSHIVHLVDFGLSKKYRDTKNQQHVPYRQGRSIVGTVRYSSINSHLGLEYSRRDDLQSLGYMLQYFYKGSLPWQGICANTNTEKYGKILEKKQNISVDHQFCDMPVEFSTYMHYCRSLKFSERPDYGFLKKLFSDLMHKLGYKNDYAFDWCKFNRSMMFENANMTLVVMKQTAELGDPLTTFADSHKKIDQGDIDLAIGSKNERNSGEMQLLQDSEEGNVDGDELEDTDFKLLSHRNKWFDNEL